MTTATDNDCSVELHDLKLSEELAEFDYEFQQDAGYVVHLTLLEGRSMYPVVHLEQEFKRYKMPLMALCKRGILNVTDGVVEPSTRLLDALDNEFNHLDSYTTA